MPLIARPAEVSKSEHWLRRAVNEKPDVLNRAIANDRHDESLLQIKWISPIVEDNFGEYRDQSFLDALGVVLPQRELGDFWPARGPQWDGLGKTPDEKIVMVEAKAYIEEMVTPPSQASEASLAKIQAALAETKEFVHGSKDSNWSASFYQYANRLAHLYLLRQLNGIDAYLVFIYFTNAPDVTEPSSEEEWKAALRVMHRVLGVGRNKLSPYVAECFVDASSLV